MAINGKNYDWEDITVRLPQGETVGITDISYKDGQGVEPRYGRGATPRGYGRKNYEASGSFTLDRDEFERLKKELAGTGAGGIYDHTPFPVVVSYANSDQPTIVDTLPACKVTSHDTSSAQGDDNAGQVKCEITILSPILWNGVPAKVDRKVSSLTG